ncbi:hypothetical protein [Segniliparus rugosus]|uniref:Uncharacterized protein n=1 Tax=Segniliparus rugosus (strain ATCC BAA-974 / DSM 45345 / CCUG 50838 / CIP 108380 / JCM 13579 / CDC 945) TaxID=679197 RepID=E5XT41_SEGRC|nr:hypothetical protein [Segniliparus rugosus]EFV12452.1 hypothetical protein HMPREF9336_02663 [Segniliparus rugosus ATCC BAA-974]
MSAVASVLPPEPLFTATFETLASPVRELAYGEAMAFSGEGLTMTVSMDAPRRATGLPQGVDLGEGGACGEVWSAPAHLRVRAENARWGLWHLDHAFAMVSRYDGAPVVDAPNNSRHVAGTPGKGVPDKIEDVMEAQESEHASPTFDTRFGGNVYGVQCDQAQGGRPPAAVEWWLVTEQGPKMIARWRDRPAGS